MSIEATSKNQTLIQALRDAILLEADFLNLHADVLDAFAAGEIARSVMEKRAKVAAIAVRARAKMLNEVLEASQPKAEAQTS